MISSDCLNGFFNTVQYQWIIQDDSLCSKIEAAADLCRMPSRWLAAELWGGGKTYIIQFDKVKGAYYQEKSTSAIRGIEKIVRIVLGLLLSLPGQIVGAGLMGIAYISSEEIRLKHRASLQEFYRSEDRCNKFNSLIRQRVILI